MPFHGSASRQLEYGWSRSGRDRRVTAREAMQRLRREGFDERASKVVSRTRIAGLLITPLQGWRLNTLGLIRLGGHPRSSRQRCS